MPQRSLKQGYLLSHYLFILGMNVLSCMLNKVEAKNKIKGIKTNKRSPLINHLLYANDFLIFLKVDLDSCGYISKIPPNFGKCLAFK